MLEAARCSPIGNCGAGATGCACPILISVNLREAASATTGGGSTIAGCGAWTSRLEFAERTSGAGATTESDKNGVCFSAVFTSGAGATKDEGSTGSFKSEGEPAIAAVGIVGVGRPKATMFGNGTS
jgi:hypothetical protein